MLLNPYRNSHTPEVPALLAVRASVLWRVTRGQDLNRTVQTGVRSSQLNSTAAGVRFPSITLPGRQDLAQRKEVNLLYPDPQYQNGEEAKVP